MYSVDITSLGETAYKVKSKDYECVVDTAGNGMTPPDTLLTSLGTCIGVYIRKYFRNTSQKADNFEIRVWGDLTEKPPYRFEKINVRIDLKGVKLDEVHMKAFLNFIQNCPVHNTIELKPVINFVIG